MKYTLLFALSLFFLSFFPIPAYCDAPAPDTRYQGSNLDIKNLEQILKQAFEDCIAGKPAAIPMRRIQTEIGRISRTPSLRPADVEYLAVAYTLVWEGVVRQCG